MNRSQLYWVKGFITLVVFLSIQFLLTGLHVLWILDIKLILTMLFSIFLLTWATQRNKTSSLKQVFAIQTLVVSLFTMTLYALKGIAEKSNQTLIEALTPLLYGLALYLCIYICLDLFIKETEEVTSYEATFVALGLTARERAIATLILEGKTNKEIAQDLYIAESTVKKHIQNTFKKVECDNRQEFTEVILQRAIG